MDYPLLLSTQLKQQLRSLRKARGLTQARLAQLLGVGQSRVADIEANPGVVSVDQLLAVLVALDAQLVLRDKQPGAAAVEAPKVAGGVKAVGAAAQPPTAAPDSNKLPDEPTGAW